MAWTTMRAGRDAMGLCAALGAGVAIACTTPQPPHGAGVDAPPSASPAMVVPATPPVASSSVVAPTAPSPPVAARLPARASTPAKIACETVDCDLESEVCCVVRRHDGSTTGSCAAKPAGQDSGSPCCPGRECSAEGMTVDRRCDEAGDCPAGHRCGELDAGEGLLEQQFCAVRWEVEICLAGSTCRNGNGCVAQVGALVGRCPLQIAPPSCGAKVCKLGETCCWNVEDHRGRCSATCDEGERPFECTSPAHCDHSSCDASPGSLQYDCGGGGHQGSVLCRTVKDCPEHLSAFGSYPGARTARACKHQEGTPPGAKACVYE